MLWLQAGLCFALWLGYGWFLRRRSERIMALVSRQSRTRRIAMGSLGIIASGAALLAALAGVAASEGIVDGMLRPWAWLAVSIVGLAFVHGQVLCAAALFSLAVGTEPGTHAQASTSTENSSQ